MGSCASTNRKRKIHVESDSTSSSLSTSPVHQITINLDTLDPSTVRPKLVTPEDACLNICKNSLKLLGFSHDKVVKKCIVSQSNLGFLSVLNFAYTNHYHLQLSVSDFLLMIAQGLSQHLKKRNDIIGRELLNYNAKSMIKVRDSSKLVATKTWNKLFPALNEQVRSRYKENVYDVINDDTSRSTASTKIATQITLLNQLEEIEGKNERVLTGLPKITMEGSIEDWEKLKLKVYKLKELNDNDKLLLDWWLKYLIPIVEKLCEQAKSKVADIEFWKNFFIVNSNVRIPYIQGWINVFLPYITAHGDLHPNESVDWSSRLGEDYFGVMVAQVPSGLSAVAFQCHDDEKLIDLLMVSGFLGAKVTGENNVRAEHFWGIFGENDASKA